jgi:acetolactate synthase-1/2/3 large subunit
VVVEGSAAVELALREPRGSALFDLGGDRASPAGVGAQARHSPAATIRVPGHRPAIIAGMGARGCADALRRAVDGLRIPVLTTYRAKGVVPDASPNAAGLFTGFPREGRPLAEADAIVTVGLDPVELLPTPWCWDAPVVSLCDVPPNDRAQVPEGHTVVGALDQLLGRLVFDDGGWPTPAAPWRQAMLAAVDVPVTGLSPQDVVRAARSALPPGAIATIDAGAHMLVAMAFWEVDEPRQCLISSGLATMAFALPAAIGASYASEAPVVCFIGDGGLGMCAAELETLARTGRDVRVVVFNDACLSLIRIKQTGRPTAPPSLTHRSTTRPVLGPSGSRASSSRTRQSCAQLSRSGPRASSTRGLTPRATGQSWSRSEARWQGPAATESVGAPRRRPTCPCPSSDP